MQARHLSDWKGWNLAHPHLRVSRQESNIPLDRDHTLLELVLVVRRGKPVFLLYYMLLLLKPIFLLYYMLLLLSACILLEGTVIAFFCHTMGKRKSNLPTHDSFQLH